MSMLSFITTPELFLPQVARRTLPERCGVPLAGTPNELPIRLSLRDEIDTPCAALVPLEEDLERWDGLS